MTIRPTTHSTGRAISVLFVLGGSGVLVSQALNVPYVTPQNNRSVELTGGK